MRLPRLNVDAVLGEGSIYQCRGVWRGVVGRPSPDVLSAKMSEYGFESVFRPGEEFECSNTQLVGFIRTTRAGLKVVDAYHAIGALGGTDGGVWMSECTQAQFDANLLSRSLGELAGEVLEATKSALEAAAGATSILAWLTKHWQIVALVAVSVVALVAVAYLTWKARTQPA